MVNGTIAIMVELGLACQLVGGIHFHVNVSFQAVLENNRLIDLVLLEPA